jgi:hypothetical protein
MKNTTWRLLRDKLVEHLKGKAVTLFLKNVLGTALGGTFMGKVALYIVKHLFDQVATPIIKAAVRKGFLIVDKTSGKIKVKKINKAKEDEDEDTYIDVIGSV